MKIPPRLIPLVEDGIIDEVIGQVKSGKEADVFIVRVGEDIRCAKVYKEANNRSFRQAVQYQEGRTVQNSRSARAMSKRTRYGQKEAEKSWITAEVEALNKLSGAGIRVPRPFGFFDGVLIMELILGEDGEVAPRLNDLTLTPETALLYHEELIAQIVRMLCLGLIHGDLSEFNVLVDAEGPVIIDLPQAVNAAGNNSAGMMFARDVNNMAEYFGRFEPGILGLKYAKEIWALYEKGKLTPHAELTGQFTEPTRTADVGGVLSAIGDARKEHEDRLLKKALDREMRGREARGAESHGPTRSQDREPPREEPSQSPGRHHDQRHPSRPGNPDQRHRGGQGTPDPRNRGGQGNQASQGQRPYPGPHSGRGNQNPQRPANSPSNQPGKPPAQGPQRGQPQGQGHRPQGNPRKAPDSNPQGDQQARPPGQNDSQANPWGRRASSGGRNRPK